MTQQQLSLVIKVLTEQGGYRVQPRLVSVADVNFEFDAILRGPEQREALVVVVRADEERLPLVASRVRALSHTMLRSGSRRPLTLVALVDAADISTLRELASICRIVPVTATDEHGVGADLRSLLPLRLPAPTAAQSDTGRVLRSTLGELASDPLVASLLAAGKKSSDAVETEVARAIEAAIAEHLSEEPHNA